MCARMVNQVILCQSFFLNFTNVRILAKKKRKKRKHENEYSAPNLTTLWKLRSGNYTQKNIYFSYNFG